MLHFHFSEILPSMDPGCHNLWRVQKRAMNWRCMLDGGLRVSSLVHGRISRLGTVGRVLLEGYQQSCGQNIHFSDFFKVFLWHLGVLPFDKRWRCWKPTGAALSIKIVFSIPFLFIVRMWSRTSSIINVYVDRGSSLIYLTEVFRSAANVVNGVRFTWTIFQL